MKLVVDTNVLITYYWKQSIIHEILKLPFHFISLEYALTEIQHHKQEIIKKSKCSHQTFQQKSEQMGLSMDFIPLDNYASSIKKASQLFDRFDRKRYDEFLKDIDFYALALWSDSSIWTNDALFKEQDEIFVFSTKEMIKLCRHLIKNGS